MSVAASTTTESKGSSQPMNLWTASLLGGIYVLASLAVVFYAVPLVWNQGAGNWIGETLNKQIKYAGQVLLQVAAVVGLILFGMKLAGPHPIKGIRGGITLAISSIFTAFFLVKGFFQIVERMATKLEFGQFLSLAFVSFCLFLFWKFLRSDRMQRWSVALEDAGWFDTSLYKKNQGVRVRRFTIFGVMLVFGSGVYTLVHNNIITNQDWVVAIPFSGMSLMLLPDIKFTIPLILIGLTIWFAWRLVNYPVFADFLIATEAEINKVSWTPRPKLIRDTIVVLITVFIITLFLFLVDIFWGFLLSRSWIGVLPSDAEQQTRQTIQVNPNEW